MMAKTPPRQQIFTKTNSDDILQLPYHPDVMHDVYICSQVHCPGPEDSKKGIICEVRMAKYHQDIQFPPKPHFGDIPDLLDHPDGVTKYCLGMDIWPLIISF